jgi:hypothetical protein
MKAKDHQFFLKDARQKKTSNHASRAVLDLRNLVNPLQQNSKENLLIVSKAGDRSFARPKPGKSVDERRRAEESIDRRKRKDVIQDN